MTAIVGKNELGLRFFMEAKRKGWVTPTSPAIVKEASAPTQGVFVDTVKLAEALRSRKLFKQAQELESALLEYREAELQFSEMLKLGHPDGDFTVAEATGDLADMETLESTHRKFMANVKKKASLNKFAVGEEFDEEQPNLDAPEMQGIINQVGEINSTLADRFAATGLLDSNFSYSGQNWGAAGTRDQYSKDSGTPAQAIIDYNKWFTAIHNMGAGGKGGKIDYSGFNNFVTASGANFDLVNRWVGSRIKLPDDSAIPAEQKEAFNKGNRATFAPALYQQVSQVYNQIYERAWANFEKTKDKYVTAHKEFKGLASGISLNARSAKDAINSVSNYLVKLQNSVRSIKPFAQAVYGKGEVLDVLLSQVTADLAPLLTKLEGVAGVVSGTVSDSDIGNLIDLTKRFQVLRRNASGAIRDAIDDNLNKLIAATRTVSRAKGLPFSAAKLMVAGNPELSMDGARNPAELNALLKQYIAAYSQAYNQFVAELGVK